VDRLTCHRHERHSARRRWRLPRPITRFVAWWASVFALVGPFSVCPFCGQPGCGMGAAAAGVLGGFVAALITFPKYIKQVVTQRRCDQSL
jgi:membrane associated rhomboid family serine protease